MSHYGKKWHCLAANHCRAPLHGKDIFPVRSKQHARQRNSAWQRLKVAHDNETLHGKVPR
jgi:hypothetical protein